MNTILVYPKLEFAGTQMPIPPYSVLFIADYLYKQNIDVNVVDLRFEPVSKLMDEIGDKEPEYIGFSVMTGPQIHHALKICSLIKQEFKDIKIVWGGIHSTILPGQTLVNDLIDMVIRGEGEIPYYDLVSGREKSQIKGLSFKKGRKIIHNPNSNLLSKKELNELSIPWNLINPQEYIQNKSFTIITSRGCPNKCSFCYNTLLNNVWRGWSAEKCREEINKVMDLGANKINFYDDNFFANPSRIRELFSYFKENNIKWKAELRVDRLNESLAEEAHNSGCSQMYFGVESGSQKVLNILNKNISIRDILNSAVITKDKDIIADYSWMIGIPGENKDDVKNTLSLIKRIEQINPECEYSVKILFPYPKTILYNQALKMGFKPPVNLSGWANIRRESASKYLKNRNLLEMISITSAVVGRKIFEQDQIPVFKFIRAPANFRWKYEFFHFGFENFFFKIFRPIIEKFIDKGERIEYDTFSREFIIK